MDLGLEEEGLFRLSAGQAKVRKPQSLTVTNNYKLKRDSEFSVIQVKRLRAEIEAGQVSGQMEGDCTP